MAMFEFGPRPNGLLSCSPQILGKVRVCWPRGGWEIMFSWLLPQLVSLIFEGMMWSGVSGYAPPYLPPPFIKLHFCFLAPFLLLSEWYSPIQVTKTLGLHCCTMCYGLNVCVPLQIHVLKL